MPEIKARGILLDIEGTTSSISFVYDVMFPYVRQNVESFLDSSWDDVPVQECLPLLACLLYTSPSPRDKRQSRMPSSA